MLPDQYQKSETKEMFYEATDIRFGWHISESLQDKNKSYLVVSLGFQCITESYLVFEEVPQNTLLGRNFWFLAGCTQKNLKLLFHSLKKVARGGWYSWRAIKVKDVSILVDNFISPFGSEFMFLLGGRCLKNTQEEILNILNSLWGNLIEEGVSPKESAGVIDLSTMKILPPKVQEPPLPLFEIKKRVAQIFDAIKREPLKLERLSRYPEARELEDELAMFEELMGRIEHLLPEQVQKIIFDSTTVVELDMHLGNAWIGPISLHTGAFPEEGDIAEIVLSFDISNNSKMRAIAAMGWVNTILKDFWLDPDAIFIPIQEVWNTGIIHSGEPSKFRAMVSFKVKEVAQESFGEFLFHLGILFHKNGYLITRMPEFLQTKDNQNWEIDSLWKKQLEEPKKRI